MNWWKDHGTKVIGTAGAAVSVLSVASPDQISALFGPNAAGYVLGALNLLTVMRGFQNSKANGPTTPGQK
jgi:hypothetical protein